MTGKVPRIRVQNTQVRYWEIDSEGRYSAPPFFVGADQTALEAIETLTEQRDQARDWAVQLEQQNAHLKTRLHNALQLLHHLQVDLPTFAKLIAEAVRDA